MIAHLSIPSKTPRETALFFAAVIDGSGLAVEVHPEEMAHHPGTGEVDPSVRAEGPAVMPWEDQIFAERSERRASGFHIAMATRRRAEEILARAKALGWRALACERAGVFGVIEVWVDDRHLIEVLISKETARYRAFMNPEGCRAMFGEPVAPPPIGGGGR